VTSNDTDDVFAVVFFIVFVRTWCYDGLRHRSARFECLYRIKGEWMRGERARINEARKWNIRTLKRGRWLTFSSRIRARIRVSLALVSLSLFFSDSVLTRV
jgi:hypothetical protein